MEKKEKRCGLQEGKGSKRGGAKQKLCRMVVGMKIAVKEGGQVEPCLEKFLIEKTRRYNVDLLKQTQWNPSAVNVSRAEQLFSPCCKSDKKK